MEVLASCLAHNPGVALIDIEVGGDILPQLLENEGATSEVERGKAAVVDGLRDDLGRGTRGELDNTGGNTGFGKDVVDEVVGVCGGRRRFPDNDVANKGRR